MGEKAMPRSLSPRGFVVVGSAAYAPTSPYLDGRLNVHARSCTFHARHPPAIMRTVKPRDDEGEKEIAKARGGRRARQKAACTLLYVEKTTTTICQRLRDGSGFSLSFSLCIYLPLVLQSGEKAVEREEIGWRREDALLQARRGTFFLYVDRGYKSSR